MIDVISIRETTHVLSKVQLSILTVSTLEEIWRK